MSISEAGVEVIADREGLRTEAYQDSKGIWTIGVGHTENVHPGDTMTEEEAMDLFADDLEIFEKAVNDAIHEPMQQHEFDAFVSIAFNIGTNGFASSTFVEEYNAGNLDACADAILWWDEPDEIRSRRAAEHMQFLGYVARIATPVTVV
jgi:lysozyme